MSNMSLGQRLRCLREALGYTQEQISNLINVERQTYTNYENGYRTPPLDCLIQLADLFGTSIDYLVRDFVPDRSDSDSVIRELLYGFQKLNSANQKDVRDYVRYKIWTQESSFAKE